MDIEDNLFGDFLPKKNFASSQASISTCTSHRSRLSLPYWQRAHTVNTPSQESKHTESFVKPLAVNKTNYKRKFGTKKTVFCPKCGLPEKLLVNTLAFHVSTCKGKNDMTEDCEAGEACPSSCVKHFRTHRHTLSPKPNTKMRCTVPTKTESIKQEISQRDLDITSLSSRPTLYNKPYNVNASPLHVNLTPGLNGVSVQRETEKTRDVGRKTDDVNFDKSNDNPSECMARPAMNNGDNHCNGRDRNGRDGRVIKSSQKPYLRCDSPEKVTPSKDQQMCNGPRVTSSKESWKTCNTSLVTSPLNALCHSGPSVVSLSNDSWKTCNMSSDLNLVKVVSPLSIEPLVESMSRGPHTTARRDNQVQENEIQRAVSWDGSFSDEFESPSLLQITTDPNNFPFTSPNNMQVEQNENGQESINKDVDDNIDIHSLSTVRREVIRSPSKTLDDCGRRSSGKTELNCHANIRMSEPGKEVDSRTPVHSSTVPCRCEAGNDLADNEAVCANVTVRVSPAGGSSTPSSTPPIAVKVNATCRESGWEAIGIDADSNVSVRDVRVSLCECARKLVLDCSVADGGTGRSKRATTFRPKFHSTMEELGITGTANASAKKRQVQLSITSFLKCSKRAKTLPKPDEDDVECLSITSSDLSKEVVGDTLVERQRRNKLAWQQLMKVNKSRDFTYVSAGSSSEGSHSGNNSDRIAPTVGARKCPFYKKIPGTTFVVDAFNHGNIPGVDAYFLSHFHYDHYIGLRRSFNQQIYCTSITASLVRLKIGVNSKYLKELKLDEVMMINGVRVTALEANHCPGSAMFLFQLGNGKTFLHVGDFRADPIMESYPAFWNLSIDKLFLDTTYCNPRYTFPSQLDTIAEVVRCAERQLALHPKTLFVCGSYTIGKEKVFVGVAEAIDAKLWANVGKRQILKLLNDPVITSRLVADPLQAQVHVCEMKYISHEHLQAQLSRYRPNFTHLLAFKPSGWEYSGDLHLKRDCRGKVTVVGVPYSEHSSFSELRRFVQFVKPAQVIPTVNVGRPEMRRDMQKHFDEWLKDSIMDIRNFFPRTLNR